MFIEGDKIYHGQHYPNHFGVGKDRYDEKMRSELAKHFVRTISINGNDVQKDFCGNVNLNITTREDLDLLNETLTKAIETLSGIVNNLAKTVSLLEKEINEDNDNLYGNTYDGNTETLTIIPKKHGE